MRNRALIANWVLEHADGAAEIVEQEDKHYLKVNDYSALRDLFAKLLAEIQRIKSEGDYQAARQLVERYGVKIDPTIHKEIRNAMHNSILLLTKVLSILSFSRSVILRERSRM